jgi:hypothetical protein
MALALISWRSDPQPRLRGCAAVLGGSNWFEHFLEPSYRRARRGGAAEHGPEGLLMLVSIAVAAAGIGVAVYFFLRTSARRTASRSASPACTGCS